MCRDLEFIIIFLDDGNTFDKQNTNTKNMKMKQKQTEMFIVELDVRDVRRIIG